MLDCRNESVSSTDVCVVPKGTFSASRIYLWTAQPTRTNEVSFMQAYGASYSVGRSVYSSAGMAIGNFDSEEDRDQSGNSYADVILGNRLFLSSLRGVGAVPGDYSHCDGLRIGSRSFSYVWTGDLDGVYPDDIVGKHEDDGSVVVYLGYLDQSKKLPNTPSGLGFRFGGELVSKEDRTEVNTVSFVKTIAGYGTDCREGGVFGCITHQKAIFVGTGAGHADMIWTTARSSQPFRTAFVNTGARQCPIASNGVDFALPVKNYFACVSAAKMLLLEQPTSESVFRVHTLQLPLHACVVINSMGKTTLGTDYNVVFNEGVHVSPPLPPPFLNSDTLGRRMHEMMAIRYTDVKLILAAANGFPEQPCVRRKFNYNNYVLLCDVSFVAESFTLEPYGTESSSGKTTWLIRGSDNDDGSPSYAGVITKSIFNPIGFLDNGLWNYHSCEKCILFGLRYTSRPSVLGPVTAADATKFVIESPSSHDATNAPHGTLTPAIGEEAAGCTAHRMTSDVGWGDNLFPMGSMVRFTDSSGQCNTQITDGNNAEHFGGTIHQDAVFKVYFENTPPSMPPDFPSPLPRPPSPTPEPPPPPRPPPEEYAYYPQELRDVGWTYNDEYLEYNANHICLEPETMFQRFAPPAAPDQATQRFKVNPVKNCGSLRDPCQCCRAYQRDDAGNTVDCVPAATGTLWNGVTESSAGSVCASDVVLFSSESMQAANCEEILPYCNDDSVSKVFEPLQGSKHNTLSSATFFTDVNNQYQAIVVGTASGSANNLVYLAQADVNRRELTDTKDEESVDVAAVRISGSFNLICCAFEERESNLRMHALIA